MKVNLQLRDIQITLIKNMFIEGSLITFRKLNQNYSLVIFEYQ